MKEVLIRRWKDVDLSDTGQRASLPDVFVLDGGKGQLGVVRELAADFSWFYEITKVVHFCSI